MIFIIFLSFFSSYLSLLKRQGFDSKLNRSITFWFKRRRVNVNIRCYDLFSFSSFLASLAKLVDSGRINQSDVVALNMEERGNEGVQNERQGCNDEEEIVCLDESFFINDNYQLTKFTFGSQDIQLFCLHSASTDFDLTGQLVWPGAMLMNDFLSKNVDMFQGCTVIELGSGVGITGILCSRFCNKVVLTDHNEEVLKIIKKNIELHSCPGNVSPTSHGLVAEKLEWGNTDQINEILRKHPGGFDFVLGADICFQQSSIPTLFDSVRQLLQVKEGRKCKFILAYVSRAKTMDSMIISEASKLGMQMKEVPGTRCIIRNLEGVIFEITLE